MNKSKKIFSVLVILIIDILALVAQPTPVPGENCDKPQSCNDSVGFAYVFCKQGDSTAGTSDSLIAHCVKDPNNAVDSYSGKPLKPLKRTMPVCAKLARIEGDTTFNFTIAELQSKIDQAAGGWNCLCDFPNNSNTCCARIIFTPNTDLLPPSALGYTPGLTPKVVPQPCDQFPCDTESTKIYIVNDLKSRIAYEFYLEDTSNLVQNGFKDVPVSLTTLIQHEIGHYANMNHLDRSYRGFFGAVKFDERADCGDSMHHAGVMSPGYVPSKTRERLSNDDKCEFMLLYCPEKIGTTGVSNERAVTGGVGSLYPNPTRNTFVIPISIAKPSKVKVTLYNALGSRVLTLQEGDNITIGNYTLEYNAKNLANGEYLCVIDINGIQETRKFVVRR